jgi:2',3'-cyclic-nucleotide 2'-phosphodiesterase (5'-nucleotidase family)
LEFLARIVNKLTLFFLNLRVISTLQTFLIPLFCFLFFFSPSVYADQKLTIIYTAGMAEMRLQEEQGSLAQLATLLHSVRQQNQDLIFLHGGATLAPSVLSTIDKGAHMVALLNLLKPDAMALARSELVHKEDELTLRTFEAGFPMISANLYDPATKQNIEGTFPYRLIKKGVYTLGILAQIDPEVISDYLPKRVHLLDTDMTIRRYSKEMRDQGADLIIYLSDFRTPRLNQYLDEKIVDLALVSAPTIIGETAVTTASYHEFPSGIGIATRIDLDLKGKGPALHWTSSFHTEKLSAYPKDQRVSSEIGSYLSKLENIYSKVIGRTSTEIDTRRDQVRRAENGFGNLLADILRDFYKSDIALINGGAIRGNKQYPAGTPITRGDIHRELPFNNRIIEIKVSGRQIIDGLENGLSRIKDLKGRFPHISGMNVEYDPSLPSGHRIVKVTIGEQLLEEDKTYTLATLDYIASGGDGYTAFTNCDRLAKIGGGKLFWEYVRNYVANQNEIAPKVDGRMKRLSR